MAAATSLLAPKEMGVGAVARARGWGRRTARRWMREIEARWGTRFVYRRGRRMYTTDVALEMLLAASKERRIEAMQRDHEERISDLERVHVAIEEQLVTLIRAMRLPHGPGAKLRKA